MRFTRLRRAIECGTLVAPHGARFQGSKDVSVEPQQKGQRCPIEAPTKPEATKVPSLQPTADHTPKRPRPRLVKSEESSSDELDADDQSYEDEDCTPPSKRRRTCVPRLRKPPGDIPTTPGPDSHAPACASSVSRRGSNGRGLQEQGVIKTEGKTRTWREQDIPGPAE